MSISSVISSYDIAKQTKMNSSAICSIHLNNSESDPLNPLIAFVEHCCIMLNETKSSNSSSEGIKTSPSSLETWLFGFVSVAIIAVGSLLGLAIFPCIRRSTYELAIKFMVALAVGSLVATGCLFLLPEALGIAALEANHPLAINYQYKCAAVCAGIYMFFLGEHLIKRIVLSRQSKHEKELQLVHLLTTDGDLTHKAIADMSVGYTPLKNEQYGGSARSEVEFVRDDDKFNGSSNVGISKSMKPAGSSSETSQAAIIGASPACTAIATQNGALTTNDESENLQVTPGKRAVQPVAYMILLGDGLHNFIDGLAIGTAYTMNVLTGISVTLAVLCEELPHELGDFAVMVNAGLSLRRAALYNFLCACTIFIGLVVGILVGEGIDDSSAYIFAIAAGMFLYIGLADMLPELLHGDRDHDASHGAGKVEPQRPPDDEDPDDLVHKLSGRWLFVVQNIGILTGFFLLFLLSIFGGDLEHAIMSLSNSTS